MRQVRYTLLYICVCACLTTLLASCDEMHDPELHAAGRLDLEIVIDQEIALETLWGVDWEQRWLYDWDETIHGPIGYTEPETYHLDNFVAGTRNHVNARDMLGHRVRLNMSYGVYDMLSYNNDFELIRIDEAKDWSAITAYTERNTYARVPSSMKARQSFIAEMPDQLFSVLNKGIVIDDDLTKYEWDEQEGVWLLKIENVLQPRVFIYLVQVRLLNNNGRVINSGSLTIDGLAESVELMTGHTSTNTTAHQFASYFTQYTQPDGNTVPLIAGKMTTFGICNEEIWTRYKAMRQAQQSTKIGFTRPATSPHNTCHVELIYKNGGRLDVPVDITDQIWAQPVGGVIDIILDVDEYEEPQEPSAGGGGIDIGVGGWNEDIHDITV